MTKYYPSRFNSLRAALGYAIFISCLMSFYTNSYKLSAQSVAEKSTQPTQPQEKTLEPLSIDAEQGLHPWQRYIRGFRKKHHFSFALGVSKQSWDLSKVDNIAKQKFSNSGISLKFKYHYHLNITYDFGFFLGSTFGITRVFTSSESSIDTLTSVEYPGVLAGVVYNRSPNFRIWFAAERYLERMDPITIRYNDRQTKNGLTMTTYDFSLGTDYFVLRRWALTFEAHYRYAEHNRLQSKENSTNSLSISFERQDFGLGFGLTFHIL